MNNCRYSGWPGAWCLDCGREDPFEVWLADGNDPDTDEMPEVPDCPEPGSNRHNPYKSSIGYPTGRNDDEGEGS